MYFGLRSEEVCRLHLNSLQVCFSIGGLVFAIMVLFHFQLVSLFMCECYLFGMEELWESGIDASPFSHAMCLHHFMET